MFLPAKTLRFPDRTRPSRARRSCRVVWMLGLDLLLGGLTGCQTAEMARPLAELPPEPEICMAAWLPPGTADGRLRRSPRTRHPGVPALLPPPAATLITPAAPYYTGGLNPVGPGLAPQTLDGDFGPPGSPVWRASPDGPPLMPPEPAPTASPPQTPEQQSPAPQDPSPAAASPQDDGREQIEQRLAALELQLAASQDALRAVTAALQAAHAEIARMHTEIDQWRSEVARLEDVMDARHAADLEALDQLSTALDGLIQRQSQPLSTALETKP